MAASPVQSTPLPANRAIIRSSASAHIVGGAVTSDGSVQEFVP